jgi:nicotinamidase/pyrazinamidase
MHLYGACYHDLGDQLSTGVIEYFKVKAIETIIVGGLATDYCVKTTALQLRAAGFEVIVNLEACRGIAEGSVSAAIEEMKMAGIVIINRTQELGEKNEQ